MAEPVHADDDSHFAAINACKCLNLQLSILPLSPSLTAVNQQSRPPQFSATSYRSCQLLSKEIQQPSLTSITTVRASTNTDSDSGSGNDSAYILFHCINCSMDCFAIHDSLDSASGVIISWVNRALVHSEEMIESIRQSQSYSRAFNLLLSAADSTNSNAGSRSAITPVNDSLKLSMDRAIETERVAMKMRISQFEAQQQEQFALFEKKTKKELHLLSSIAERRESPVPLSVFARRPSRQSPRLQRFLMEGVKHSASTNNLHVSDTDTNNDSAHDSGNNDDDSSALQSNGANTPTRLAPLSSSLPRVFSLSSGRLSPVNRTVNLPMPQLSGVIRKHSHASNNDDDGDDDVSQDSDEEMNRSEKLMVMWRETQPVRSDDEDEDTAVRGRQRMHSAEHRPTQHRTQTSNNTDYDNENGIFRLDEDSDWKIPATSREISSHSFHEDDDTKHGDAGDDDDIVDDGDLSDEEIVARTSDAEIRDMAHRSSIPVVPIKSSANASAIASQYAAVPSSLPIPIPTGLRQLVEQRDNSSSNSSRASSTMATKGSLSSVMHRDSSLPIVRSSFNSNNSDLNASMVSNADDGSSSSHNDSDFVPPHTMAQPEPFFSFAKFRHIAGSISSPRYHHLANLSSSLPVSSLSLSSSHSRTMGGHSNQDLFTKENLTASTSSVKANSSLTGAIRAAQSSRAIISNAR